MALPPIVERGLNAINDFLHWPVIYELSWFVYWGTQLLLGPIYWLFFVPLWVFDGLRGRFWPAYNEPKGRAVLVTGCDTGFGHEFALELVAKGWRVYAGCLTDAGMAALKEKAGPSGAALMVPVKMDVTKQADVDAAVARIRADRAHLYALVNNAGIGRGSPIPWTPMEEYRSIMEVNYFAMVYICKACFPLLRETRGRVVNMISVAGLASAPLMSGYCASKHAAEAFSTCLRAELMPWGIKVITLNPSFHKTAIAINATSFLVKSYENLPAEEKALYGDDYFKKCVDVCDRFTKGSWDPKNVVRALLKATLLVNPSLQYIVGMDGRFQFIPLVMMPIQMQVDVVKAVVFRNFVPAAYQKGGRFFGREREMELPTVVTPAGGANGGNGNGNGGY